MSVCKLQSFRVPHRTLVRIIAPTEGIPHDVWSRLTEPEGDTLPGVGAG